MAPVEKDLVYFVAEFDLAVKAIHELILELNTINANDAKKRKIRKLQKSLEKMDDWIAHAMYSDQSKLMGLPCASNVTPFVPGVRFSVLQWGEWLALFEIEILSGSPTRILAREFRAFSFSGISDWALNLRGRLI